MKSQTDNSKQWKSFLTKLVVMLNIAVKDFSYIFQEKNQFKIGRKQRAIIKNEKKEITSQNLSSRNVMEGIKISN